ncbi:MAG: flagellar hook-length control protein FliK [Alphaproteobacteria bacterium]
MQFTTGQFLSPQGSTVKGAKPTAAPSIATSKQASITQQTTTQTSGFAALLQALHGQNVPTQQTTNLLKAATNNIETGQQTSNSAPTTTLQNNELQTGIETNTPLNSFLSTNITPLTDAPQHQTNTPEATLQALITNTGKTQETPENNITNTAPTSTNFVEATEALQASLKTPTETFLEQTSGAPQATTNTNIAASMVSQGTEEIHAQTTAFQHPSSQERPLETILGHPITPTATLNTGTTENALPLQNIVENQIAPITITQDQLITATQNPEINLPTQAHPISAAIHNTQAPLIHAENNAPLQPQGNGQVPTSPVQIVQQGNSLGQTAEIPVNKPLNTIAQTLQDRGTTLPDKIAMTFQNNAPSNTTQNTNTPNTQTMPQGQNMAQGQKDLILTTQDLTQAPLMERQAVSIKGQMQNTALLPQAENAITSTPQAQNTNTPPTFQNTAIKSTVQNSQNAPQPTGTQTPATTAATTTPLQQNTQTPMQNPIGQQAAVESMPLTAEQSNDNTPALAKAMLPETGTKATEPKAQVAIHERTATASGEDTAQSRNPSFGQNGLQSNTGTAQAGSNSAATPKGQQAAASFTESLETISQNTESTLTQNNNLLAPQAQDPLNALLGKAITQKAEAEQTLHKMPMTDQVAVNIQKAVKEGQDQITLRLNPASLGKVAIKMEIEQGSLVRAMVSASEPETLKMLKQDASALQDALKEAGLETDDTTLSFTQDDHGHESGQEQHASAKQSFTSDQSLEEFLENSENTIWDQPKTTLPKVHVTQNTFNSNNENESLDLVI